MNFMEAAFINQINRIRKQKRANFQEMLDCEIDLRKDELEAQYRGFSNNGGDATFTEFATTVIMIDEVMID